MPLYVVIVPSNYITRSLLSKETNFVVFVPCIFICRYYLKNIYLSLVSLLCLSVVIVHCISICRYCPQYLHLSLLSLLSLYLCRNCPKYLYTVCRYCSNYLYNYVVIVQRTSIWVPLCDFQPLLKFWKFQKIIFSLKFIFCWIFSKFIHGIICIRWANWQKIIYFVCLCNSVMAQECQGPRGTVDH